MSAKLFQYAILWHPTKEQEKDGRKSMVVMEPTTILAESEQVAQMIAVKAIPDTYINELNQIVVALRPF